jgi:hypothetical protein
MNEKVNSGDIDSDAAVKSIIAYYGKSDPKLAKYNNSKGNTVYEINDAFKSQQIALAIDAAGLRPYVNEHKDAYIHSYVNGTGFWILQ